VFAGRWRGRTIKLVIFDCDGVLVDTETISAKVGPRCPTDEPPPPPRTHQRSPPAQPECLGWRAISHNCWTDLDLYDAYDQRRMTLGV
jgi:hypothetical protein